MSSWNSSAVPDGKLHTNSRRRQSSTPAVRQSAEDDRSALSTGVMDLVVGVLLLRARRLAKWNSLSDSVASRPIKMHSFHVSVNVILFLRRWKNKSASTRVQPSLASAICLHPADSTAPSRQPIALCNLYASELLAYRCYPLQGGESSKL